MFDLIKSALESSNSGIMSFFPRLKHLELFVRFRERQPLPRVMELVSTSSSVEETAGKEEESESGIPDIKGRGKTY